MTTDPDNLPDELKSMNRWVLNRDKIPVWPSRHWKKPENQRSFDEAMVEFDRRQGYGLGFIIREGDAIVCIDLDNVIDESGEFHQRALDIIEYLEPTYMELSSSTTGVHIFIRGTLLDGFSTKLTLDDKIWANDKNLNQKQKPPAVELFDSRHVAVTGNTITEGPDMGSLALREDEIHEIQSSVFEPKSVSIKKKSDKRSNDVPKSVDTVMKTIHEYAKSSNDNAERCWNLLNDRGGHADESKTDYELAQSLAFWCKNDADLVERVMEHSPRGSSRRDKWQKDSGSGRTNLEVTVYNAIRSRGSSVFQGHYVE